VYLMPVQQEINLFQITQSQILDKIGKIPFVEGMASCLQILKELGSEIIIISDSNTIFIDHILSGNQLEEVFSAIFTNPAHWDEEETNFLHLKPFHHNDDCNLSGANLCKGKVLYDYIQRYDNSC